LTYDAIKSSLKEGNIRGTTEFFPEEGKYHWTGHRNCGVRQSPQETQSKGTTCPKCGRPLTVGVEHRVDVLASRSEEELGLTTDAHGWIRSKMFPKRPPYRRLVPLHEILAEAVGTLPKSQKVAIVYDRLIEIFGSELTVLIKTPLEDLRSVAEPRVAEGIDKVRRNDIVVDPGFDGEYGKVKIWKEGEGATSVNSSEEEQIGLF
ncbi:MAG: DNA helicase UvrD, partial [bacterium]|nr:DNA helicase UvrD [bacterium]